MVKEILKSGFFGYSKSSVCEYIARMNEEFSQRLTAKDNENTSREAELRAQIASLREENQKLKEKQEMCIRDRCDCLPMCYHCCNVRTAFYGGSQHACTSAPHCNTKDFMYP